MARSISVNQQLAAAISEIATGAISAIVDISKSPAARQGGTDKSDYVVDKRNFDEVLRSQEGVLPRRATLLGGNSEERYIKGKPVHDASGKFRRGDAKG